MDIILEDFPEIWQPRFSQEAYIPNKSANTSSSKCTTRKAYEKNLIFVDVVGCKEAIGFSDILLDATTCETTGDAHESAALGSDAGLVIHYLGFSLSICIIDSPAYACDIAGVLELTSTEIYGIQPGPYMSLVTPCFGV